MENERGIPREVRKVRERVAVPWHVIKSDNQLRSLTAHHLSKPPIVHSIGWLVKRLSQTRADTDTLHPSQPSALRLLRSACHHELSPPPSGPSLDGEQHLFIPCPLS